VAKFIGEDAPGLEYDFTPIKKADGTYCSGRGVIPEPDRKTLKEYRRKVAEIFRSVPEMSAEDAKTIEEGGTPKNLSGSLDMLQFLDSFEELDEMTRMVLGSGASPALAHYEELPARQQDNFNMWLMQELIAPEGLSADTRRSQGTAMNGSRSTPSAGTSASR